MLKIFSVSLVLMLLSQTLLAQTVSKDYIKVVDTWERFFTDRTDQFMDAWVAKGVINKQGQHYYMTLPLKEVWVEASDLDWHEIKVQPDTMLFTGGKNWFAFEGLNSIAPDTLYYYDIEFGKQSKVLKVEVKKKKEDENKPKTGNHFGWYLSKEKKEKKLLKKLKDKIKEDNVSTTSALMKKVK